MVLGKPRIFKVLFEHQNDTRRFFYRSLETICLVFSSLVLFFLFFTSVFHLGIANDDFNLIKAISTDETLALKLLLKNIDNRDLDPRGFYAYGYVHSTISYVIITVFRYLNFDISSTRVITFATRGVSLLAYAFLALIFERSLRYLNLKLVSRLSFTALLCGSITLYRWGHRTHPDTLQTLLAFCVFYILLRGLSLRWILLSAFVAGLSFGTKPSGVFTIVIIITAIVCERLLRNKNETIQKNIIYISGTISAAIAFFVVGWLITNPYVILHLDEFLADISHQRYNLTRGQGYDVAWMPLQWLVKLHRQFIGGGTVVIAVGAMIIPCLAIYSLFNRLYYRKRTVQSIFADDRFTNYPSLSLLVSVAAYIIIAFGQLMLEVNYIVSRYMLHIIPYVVWFSAAGYAFALARWPKLPEIGLSVLLVLPNYTMAERAIRSGNDRLDIYKSQIVDAGRWLQSNYAPSTRIMVERYSYVPSNYFDTVLEVEGIIKSSINRHKPQVIVVNKKQSSRYCWKQEGTMFRDRKFVKGMHDNADRFYKFHKWLFGKTSSWKIVYEKSDVVILEKKNHQ